MHLFKIIALAIPVIAGLLIAPASCSVVGPGERGVKVHLGEVSPTALPEGLVWHLPLVTGVQYISIRQQTSSMDTECYSSDLQQINAKVKVLFRLPEDRVVELYQKYSGNVFDSLVAPRVAEALKEITSTETAEGAVKQREKVKSAALESAKKKIGDLVIIEDIVIEDLALSSQLEQAIEQKMVQEQEAAKAKFIKQKAEIEAETAFIVAKGEAEAIKVRGEAIRNNPGLIDLQIVEKWDGKSPLVVGETSGNVLLPLTQSGAK